MDTNQYLNYIRVLRDREDNRGKKAGITTWSLLVALIYVVWQLIPELSPIRTNSTLIAYVVQLYSYMQITAVITIDLFKTSQQLNRTGRFSFRISLADERNISIVHLVALLILGLLLPLVGLYNSNAYLGSTYPGWLSIQGKINIGILLFFSFISVITFFALKIYQNRTEYPSPISLIVQGKSVDGLNRFVFFPVSLLLWIGNVVCVYLIIQSLPSDSFAQVLRVSIDSMLSIFIVLILLVSTRNDNTSGRLEALERDIILHDLDKDKVRERIQDELLGHDAGEWLRTKVSLVRQKAEQVREVTRQATGVKQSILDINPEFTHEQFGRVTDYTSKLKDLTKEYNFEFESLGKWIVFSIQMVKIYKDPSLANLLNDVFTQLGEVHVHITSDVGNAVREVEAAMMEINAKRHELGLQTIAIPKFAV